MLLQVPRYARDHLQMVGWWTSFQAVRGSVKHSFYSYKYLGPLCQILLYEFMCVCDGCGAPRFYLSQHGISIFLTCFSDCLQLGLSFSELGVMLCVNLCNPFMQLISANLGLFQYYKGEAEIHSGKPFSFFPFPLSLDCLQHVLLRLRCGRPIKHVNLKMDLLNLPYLLANPVTIRSNELAGCSRHVLVRKMG